jgi:CRP-like cAMP-binding protein
LEELIDELAPGEWFAIAVDGLPRVKAIALTDAEIAVLTQDAE